MYSSVDNIWILLGTVLVFFMQAGFAMVETGFTRAKNAGNIVMKNLMDLSLGTLAFWFLGFGLMFGKNIGGFIGLPDLLVQGDYGLSGGYTSMVFFIFQTVFCLTAITIASEAMAERTKFAAYCFYSVIIGMVIYPIPGHWIWGGGWLSQLGFHDFAGSTVVHMVGGMGGLLGAKLLGPRIGKYDKVGNVNALPGHSLTLGALGVFILWFAWFGFNGSSTVSATGDKSLVTMGIIFVNTNMAAAASVATTMLFTWLRYGKPDVSMILNGALAGLVAITAGCDLVSPTGAGGIGIVSGVVIVLSVEFVDLKLRIDDPVGAISVHGCCGALGTILTGVFATQDGLFYGGGIHMLLIQFLGVAIVAIWVTITMMISLTVIKKTVGLRVREDEEALGLDMEENGLLCPYADFMPATETAILTAKKAATTEKPAFVSREAAVPVVDYSKHKTTDSIKYTKLVIVTSQDRFEALKDALDKIGITGMTVTKVLGYGLQKGSREMYRGVKVPSRLLPKVKIEIIVAKVPPEVVVNVTKKILYTGHYGDGKIFIYDVENVIKIRTGEEGYDALQDYVIDA